MIRTRSNVSVRKCIAVWDILSLVYKQVGKLPDNQTPTKLQKTTGEELLKYAVRVLHDDKLWSRIPLIIKPTRQKVAGRKKVLQQLTSSPGIKVFREPGAPTDKQLISAYAAGQNRDKVRKELRDLIKSCC